MDRDRIRLLKHVASKDAEGRVFPAAQSELAEAYVGVNVYKATRRERKRPGHPQHRHNSSGSPSPSYQRVHFHAQPPSVFRRARRDGDLDLHVALLRALVGAIGVRQLLADERDAARAEGVEGESGWCQRKSQLISRGQRAS